MRTQVSVLVSALLLSLTTQGAPMSYSFVDLQYLENQIDTGRGDIEGDGLAIRGSLSVHENVFAFAQYSDVDYESGVDGESWAIGGGGRFALRDGWDIVAKVGLMNTEIGGNDDDGFLLSAGVRGLVIESLEAEAALEYQDINEFGDTTSLVGEGRYLFTDDLSAGLMLRVGDDVRTLGVTVRYAFR